MGDGPAVPRAVLFDLDGTLVQTRIASWRIFQPISERYRLGVNDAEQFYRLFERNMFAALRELCRDERQAAEVEAAFLRGLREDYMPEMIPGMADVVRALAAHCTLGVLTSNLVCVVRRILMAHGIAYCFGHVFGGDVEPDKEHGIRRFLADAARGCGRHCAVSYDEAGHSGGRSAEGSSASDVVLVTDTVSDVKAAMAAGIRAVGVAWGMHTESELIEAGAEFVAIWPQELLTHLLPGSALLRPPPPTCAVPPAIDPVMRASHIRRARRTTPRKQSTPTERPAVRCTPLRSCPVSVPSDRVDDQLRQAVRRILPPR